MLSVKLIGATRHLEGEGKPEELIARAGRVCYKSEKRGELDKFIRARIRQGHSSILEHVQLTFEISGISRACLAQLARHRIASYSVESQRRVDATDTKFITPPSMRANSEAMEIFNEVTSAAIVAYEALRGLGVKKEDSRYVLPTAAEMKLVMSMNVRSLRNFFETRLGGGAQWEIRALAVEILRLAYKEIPSAFEDLYTVYVKGIEY